MYKQDLALSNLQWRICHKTKPNKTKPKKKYKYKSSLTSKHKITPDGSTCR